MKFGELLRVHKPELVISRRYDEWVAKNSNPVYSPEALDFAREQLWAQTYPRDRRGTVSASSLKKCMRRQAFTFLGMPEMPYSAKTSAIFQNGTFMHLRWQMAGITEGFLSACEIKVPSNPFRLSGTLDAVAYEDSVVELKSCNSNSFSRAMAFGPIAGHDYQVATYCLVTGREQGVLIYENKDTQEFTEIVLPREQLPLQEIIIANERLWEYLDRQVLPDPLDAVYENKMPCSGCPFRNVCLKFPSWVEADEYSHRSREAA